MYAVKGLIMQVGCISISCDMYRLQNSDWLWLHILIHLYTGKSILKTCEMYYYNNNSSSQIKLELILDYILLSAFIKTFI